MYNTAGTNMLCAALKRRTGENLFEYLRRVFLSRSAWRILSASACRTALKWAARAARLKTEDMARFILFVSRHGKWEGKQLLNAKSYEHGERRSGLDDQSGE